MDEYTQVVPDGLGLPYHQRTKRLRIRIKVNFYTFATSISISLAHNGNIQLQYESQLSVRLMGILETVRL